MKMDSSNMTLWTIKVQSFLDQSVTHQSNFSKKKKKKKNFHKWLNQYIETTRTQLTWRSEINLEICYSKSCDVLQVGGTLSYLPILFPVVGLQVT